ncbi:hypothetical protein OIV83_005602 [Microbotryomycetes sp. JL201]|nr:hypothetical protein OIV83_005602 [Microbotryomycetes sp. JL201]
MQMQGVEKSRFNAWHRLKLKCNRVWPCDACQRRGCADLCPDKVSQPQSRTTRLMNELQALNARVHALERVLTKAGLDNAIPPPLVLEFATNPSDDHDDDKSFTNGHSFSVGKAEPAGSRVNVHDKEDPENEEEVNESHEIDHVLAGGVGSLSINPEDGGARFLGLSAGSAYYTQQTAESTDSASDEDDYQEPPPEFPRYPFIQMGNTYPHAQEIERLRRMLPERAEIERLARNYYDFLSFQFQPLDEDVFFDDYVTSAQATGNAQGAKLACVFMILCLGSLFDPSAPSTPNPNAQHFFVLSWSTLSAARFLSHTTLAGVQTLQLCANFLLNAHDFQAGGETFWPILGMALRMLVSMGLHRDGTLWNLQNPDLDRRRTIFWELVTLERMQALISGRPYMISTRHFDTQMPPNAEPFHQEKWKLGSFIVKVIDDAFSVNRPTYSTISSLDNELRNMFRRSPAELRCGVLPANAFDSRPTTVPDLPRPNDEAPPTASLKFRMRQHTLDMIFSQILFYLHLPALRQALALYPDEPLASPWADSVRTVSLETGVFMLAIAKSWIALHPVLCPRWWHIFFHSFAASVAQSSIVIKSPRSALARHAWTQIELAIDIFERAGSGGAPPCAFVPRLRALKETALASLQAAESVPTGLMSTEVTAFLSKETDASLSILGPTTRLERKTRRKSSDRSKSSERCSPSSAKSTSQQTILTRPVTGLGPDGNAGDGMIEFRQGNVPARGVQTLPHEFVTMAGVDDPFSQLDNQFIGYGQPMTAFDRPFVTSVHATPNLSSAQHFAFPASSGLGPPNMMVPPIQFNAQQTVQASPHVWDPSTFTHQFPVVAQNNVLGNVASLPSHTYDNVLAQQPPVSHFQDQPPQQHSADTMSDPPLPPEMSFQNFGLWHGIGPSSAFDGQRPSVDGQPLMWRGAPHDWTLRCPST